MTKLYQLSYTRIVRPHDRTWTDNLFTSWTCSKCYSVSNHCLSIYICNCILKIWTFCSVNVRDSNPLLRRYTFLQANDTGFTSISYTFESLNNILQIIRILFYIYQTFINRDFSQRSVPDLNRRSLPWQGSALSQTKLTDHVFIEGWIRTNVPRLEPRDWATIYFYQRHFWTCYFKWGKISKTCMRFYPCIKPFYTTHLPRLLLGRSRRRNFRQFFIWRYFSSSF